MFSLRSNRAATITAGALTALTLAAVPATAAAPRVFDIDAELEPGNRLHLSTETASSAARVTFSFAGRTAKGYLTETDTEDATRDFERTLSARGMRPGTRKITVRACGADGCATRTLSVYVERDDD